jgi:hypothetical protein
MSQMRSTNSFFVEEDVFQVPMFPQALIHKVALNPSVRCPLLFFRSATQAGPDCSVTQAVLSAGAQCSLKKGKIFD